MAKKKVYKAKEKVEELKEPAVAYQSNRITFSTIETQSDIQLKYAISVSPTERLRMMRKLNDYAFKNLTKEKILTDNTKLIFTSYEYISR
jgi:hypothetical protein